MIGKNRPAILAVSGGPVHFGERLGHEQFAVGAVEHEEEAVGVAMHQQFAGLPFPRLIHQDHRADRIPVVHVVRA